MRESGRQATQSVRPFAAAAEQYNTQTQMQHAVYTRTQIQNMKNHVHMCATTTQIQKCFICSMLVCMDALNAHLASGHIFAAVPRGVVPRLCPSYMRSPPAEDCEIRLVSSMCVRPPSAIPRVQ